MNRSQLPTLVAAGALLLLVNTAYVAAFATPSVFYMGNVLLHLVLGVAVALGAAVLIARRPDLRRGFGPAGIAFLVATALGLYLAVVGNVRAERGVLVAHVVAAAAGLAFLVVWAFARARERGELGWRRFRGALAAACLVLVALPLGARAYARLHPDPSAKIANSMVVPASMAEEGGGPRSPFFPSSAKTNVGGIIPSNFFMDSATCGECHKDIYEQWKSSAHHFASFNNQFYRKSIEYMQDVVGTQPSKWCAGCHDHAVFFNGRFDRPIREQVDTPEARAGLACTSCHAITHVASSMGNGAFTIEYPPLHELATSKNPVVKTLDHFMTYLNPEPHRRTFLKPFMTAQGGEFCSSCHKVHLDAPVNHYRWFRGFNEYDAWQASGVSGQGARSFYYPKVSQDCIACHMPEVDSKDPGNRGGKVHSHFFAAANTALPFVNKDRGQLERTEQFLQSGFITVDLFAVSPEDEERPGQPAMVRRSGDAVPQAMTGFAVGEEAIQDTPAVIREVGKMSAPIDAAKTTVTAGSTVRVDAVVRTRRIGHFFPGGTIDAFDVWLEMKATDAKGRTIFWSGSVPDEADGSKGPVETGAHFYRTYQLDKEGNFINKRNAWQSRSVLYTRLIPPGAADVVHFRLRVPKDVEGPITLEARLNYRKFSHYYTQFAYAGKPVPGQSPALLSPHWNSLKYDFSPANIPADVSGEIKGKIPDLPIVVLAQAKAELGVAPTGAAVEWKPVVRKADRERWNDWGIGLLLQGDLKGAEYAFLRTTEAEPGYADGWVNVARALVREGENERAKPYLARALALNPKLASAHFFLSQVEKDDGDYDAALASLRAAAAEYPRDRVVLNQIARILFLKRDYRQAIAVAQQVCQVDPEDVQMHYTMMLAYRGLGDAQGAAREASLFRRFKAEESSQAITAIRRMASPEDNNERQLIHEHESAPLPPARAQAPAVGKETAVTAAGGMP